MCAMASLFTQQPMVVYMGIMIFLLWLASVFNSSSFWLFAMVFLFLVEVDRNYTKKLRREIRSEERRSAYQGRPLSDFESAEWINQAVEKIWERYLERFISQEILTTMIPWFLDKHKPWTVRKATLQRLELGGSPPKFLGLRTLKETSGDDDLVMDFCLEFAAAENMIAVLGVQMRRRIGLGIRTNIHISRMHIEGKVRVGVKFSNNWPFIRRVRACFVDAPYVQMTARPLSTHGVNVSDLPLIAGWMEGMVADVFEQSLVEPNMLVLDIEKLVSSITTLKTPESSMQDKWFDIQEKSPIAILHVKIMEASDLKPSDLNGLADPFVKVSFATFHFKTKVQRKTLKPRWFEEFNIPIASWESPTMLVLHVMDKDQFRDDDLGYCKIDIKEFRGGRDYDLWLPLQSIKMGRLHVALNITEDGTGLSCQDISSKKFQSTDQPKRDTNDVNDKTRQDVSSRSFQPPDEPKRETNHVDDKSLVEERFEVINLGRGNNGFLSIVSPGQQSRVKSWQQRQGMKRHDNVTNPKDTIESRPSSESSSSEEAGEEETPKAKQQTRRFWNRQPHKATSLDIPTIITPSHENCNEYIAVGTKGTTVRMKLEEPSESIGVNDVNDEHVSGTASPHEGSMVSENLSPSKRDHMRSRAKDFMKHAGKTAHNLTTAFTRKGSNKKGNTENEDVVEMTPGSVTPANDSRLSDEKASELRPSDEKASESRLSGETTSEPRLSDEKICSSDDRSETVDDNVPLREKV